MKIKTTYEKIFKFFDLSDFILLKYICKIYILADIKEIVENQDLYKNKDDFFSDTIKSYSLNKKRFFTYIISISGKYIF